MSETMEAAPQSSIKQKTQIRASDVPHVLKDFANDIQLLSLDCFDTLLWRKTASPKEIFSLLAERPLAKSLGVTVEQRISAAARAYRTKFVTEANRQVHLKDIYRSFTSLTEAEQNALVEEEIQIEIEMCFAFTPFVNLIREAAQRGIKVIIVSDMYLNSAELHRLLSHHLPSDVMNGISQIYSSAEFGTSKGENLFPLILKKLNVPAHKALHIGDHSISDFQTPRSQGMNALHFQQYDNKTVNFLRLQQSGAALTVLAKTTTESLKTPRYNLFGAVYASTIKQANLPETLIGYMTFGPILYAYARFLTDEIEALRQQGKRVKVFFLLRDAYLLARACEAYMGEPVGKLIRIRKFVAVAASFKSRADIDYYISGIKPEFYHFIVICEQLLLPHDLTAKLIQAANSSSTPQETFHALIHQDDVMQIIFKNSAAYRERLKRYMLNEMAIEEGDTIVLADTGFVGVTQDYLTRAFRDEFNIEIIGRYVLASNEPDKPNAKALINTSWCDHSLFEQSCTFKEGAVIDYDDNGQPIHEHIKLSEEQYQKVSVIQGECLRFIRDARMFFHDSAVMHSLRMLQATAHAALLRHVYLPLQEELEFFNCFQHDKDMGNDRKKTVYNVASALEAVKYSHPPYKMNPYDLRAVSMDLALSEMLQRGFQLNLMAEDMCARFSTVKVILVKGENQAQEIVKAMHMHDGYFSMVLPCVAEIGVGLIFGEHYQWVQMEKIKIVNKTSVVKIGVEDQLVFSGITRHGAMLQCGSKSSYLLIKPLVGCPEGELYYHVVFRPLVGAN